MVIVSALFVAGAYAPVSWWLLAIIGYLLLIPALLRTKRPVLHAWLFGLVLHLIVLRWSQIYVGVPPYLALTLLQSLFSIPLGLHIRYRLPLSFLPLTFVFSEYARSHFPFGGFGWSNIGFTQVSAPYVHLAAVGGVYLVAFFLFALVCLRTKLQAAFLAGLFLISLFISNPVGERSISVAAIQGGYVQRSDDYFSDIRKVFRSHFNLTRKVPSVDLIVWPENVVDGAPLNKEFKPFFSRLAGQELVVGATPIIKGKPENQSVHIDGSGAVRSVYTKQALVPFGEYMPFRTIIRHLNSHVDEVNDFRSGANQVSHTVKGNVLAPLICFEIVDDTVVRKAARDSTAFLAQTNSATFFGSAAAAQQFAITRMRSIEYSRSIASSSTVGITGFIDNNGEVKEVLKEGKPGVAISTLPLSSHQTPYATFGFFAVISALIFGLLGRRR